MKEIEMANGNILRVGDTICFADLWQSEQGDVRELLESGCCWVGVDEDDMPMIADFELLDKISEEEEEEDLVRVYVRITDIR